VRPFGEAAETTVASRISEWVAEAGRRRVFRTVGVYVVAVWGISSGGVDIAGVLGIPESALRIGIYAAVGSIPLIVILAWRFDIGRDGIVRDPQDVLADRQREADLAAMPTMIGGVASVGALVIRWRGPSGEQAALFTEELFLGRSAECRVRFYDPLVSRKHARIFHDGEAWQIEDLGSRSGTKLDGVSISKAPLGVDNEVRLNEDGPFLRIELVAAGAATREALGNFPPGQPTAHIRLTHTDATTVGGGKGRR